MHYLDVLRRLHEELHPAGYLEIGVDWGDSLQLSRARSVAIDPAPKPRPESLLGKPALHLYVGTSDDFFREHQRDAILHAIPLDLAFIDGLHAFPQVVRDFENVERWGHQDTVVVIRDVLPRNAWEAAQDVHHGFWTGDVWRIVPFLRQYRPDLRLWLTEAEPTGLLIITGLDPAHPRMAHLAEEQFAAFPSSGPEYDRLTDAFIAEAVPELAEDVLRVIGVRCRLEREWDYLTYFGMRWVEEGSWQPLLEAAAAWPHTPQHELGMRACLRLIEAHWLPEEVRQRAYEHLARYTIPLSSLWPAATWGRLALPDAEEAPLRAPSPVDIAGGLAVMIQAVTPNREETTWQVLELEGDFTILNTKYLDDSTSHGHEPGGPASTSSIDQIRPFVHDERLAAIVTVCDRNPRGVAQVALVTIEDGNLQDLHLFTDPANGRPERDWAPFVAGEGICAVSWWEPTEIMRIAPGEGGASREALRLAPRLAERFRGASPGVDVPGGWLFLVNERAESNDGNESCFARFVFMRHDFWVTAVSPHFWVAARGQDVASGLTRQGDDLIAGFTSCGQDALLTRIPLAAVLTSLLPLASAGAPSVSVGDEVQGSFARV